MADSDPGSDSTRARARGHRDPGRYFLLPSETAERFRRDEREPEAPACARSAKDSREDD
ncbi:hypothetical protein [Saccharopolyspora rhizosphaerae]|uniref:hypothetical protein n=1 Tax=Saccharopolyspora rhizosphaerae TaxID=2492662 RepID=UPI0013151EB9|nr:hypothetical protein [Saccharopolyspora rhizosphaerae]